MKDELQIHINKEVSETLKTHGEHLQVANKEMGIIKTDIGIIKTEIQNFKEKMSKVETLVWSTFGATLLAIITQVLIKSLWR